MAETPYKQLSVVNVADTPASRDSRISKSPRRMGGEGHLQDVVVDDSEGNLRVNTLVHKVARSSSNNKALRQGHDAACEQKRREMLEREAHVKKQLEACDLLWSNRRKSIEIELERIQREQHELSLLQDWQPENLEAAHTEPGTGHSAATWLESQTCIIACILVIIVDLGVTAIALGWPRSAIHKELDVIGKGCLIWYVVEFLLRLHVHRRTLLFGPVADVWLGWVDLAVILEGVFEVCVLPLFEDHSQVSGFSALRITRVVKALRVLRCVKVVRYFLEVDLSWTEGSKFESFIMFVVFINAFLMGLELDMPWTGWSYVEMSILSIYTFELAVRLKHAGMSIFTSDGWAWHCLDALIVVGGATEQWMMPLYCVLQRSFEGDWRTENSSGETSKSGVLTMLQILRLFRVLRLVRVVKSITPLHRLLLGVVEALQGVSGVLLLAAILLYASGIIFTTLVGHGVMYDGMAPEDAKEVFATVPKSMFALFKLMNEDQSVVDPILINWKGRLLFASFMIFSNWVVLAILTSVVSDYMISASQRSEQEDQMQQKKLKQDLAINDLVALFNHLDEDHSCSLDKSEFMTVLTDDCLRAELCQKTGLSVPDLVDLFNCLSVETEDRGRVLHYQDFIQQLHDEGKNADKRSVLHVLTFLRSMERRLVQRLDHLLEIPVGVTRESAEEEIETCLQCATKTEHL